jgi:hypothetical protein
MSLCPSDALHVATLSAFVVCERFGSLNGSFVYMPTSDAVEPIELSKRVYAQAVTPTWGGFSRQTVLSADDDMIGNALLANGREPDHAAVLAALPPIISGWGAKKQFGYAGQHSFTGSRNGSVDIVLDHLGDAGEWGGYPRPPNIIGAEYAAAKLRTYEGLVGGSLPVLHWAYEVNESVRWEMTVVPSPNEEGNHEQGALRGLMSAASHHCRSVQMGTNGARLNSWCHSGYVPLRARCDACRWHGAPHERHIL